MIEARGLTKRYGAKVAVNDLSFTVQSGKVTGFLGPNGAGKSTTMRMMLGLDRPTSGTVQINGHRYSDLKRPLRTVGALVDAKWIHPNRSAYAHLHWLARSNRIPRKRIKTVLEMVGLEEVAHRRAGGFSLGMSQRLGIASALLGDPPTVMFDEPVNGLDPEGIHWIRRFMQGLASEGRTVFVSSHLLSEMALTAEELVVVGRGELIAQCTTQEFVEGATTASVKVRSPHVGALRELLWRHGMALQAADRDEPDTIIVDSDETERIGQIAASAGLVVHELTVERGSLEDAFMHLTSEAVEYQTPSNERHGSRSSGESQGPDASKRSRPDKSTTRSGTAPRITRHGAASKTATDTPTETSPGRASSGLGTSTEPGTASRPEPGTASRPGPGPRTAPGTATPGTAPRPSMPQPATASRPDMPRPDTASRPSMPRPDASRPGNGSYPAMPPPGQPGTPTRGTPRPGTPAHGMPQPGTPAGGRPQPATPARGLFEPSSAPDGSTQPRTPAPPPGPGGSSQHGTATWPPMPEREPRPRLETLPTGPAPNERGSPPPGTNGRAPAQGTNGTGRHSREANGSGTGHQDPWRGQPPGTVRR